MRGATDFRNPTVELLLKRHKIDGIFDGIVRAEPVNPKYNQWLTTLEDN